MVFTKGYLLIVSLVALQEINTFINMISVFNSACKANSIDLVKPT